MRNRNKSQTETMTRMKWLDDWNRRAGKNLSIKEEQQMILY